MNKILAQLSQWLAPALGSLSVGWFLQWPPCMPHEETGRNVGWLFSSLFLIGIFCAFSFWTYENKTQWSITCVVTLMVGALMIFPASFGILYLVLNLLRGAENVDLREWTAQIFVPFAYGVVHSAFTLEIFVIAAFVWRLVGGEAVLGKLLDSLHSKASD